MCVRHSHWWTHCTAERALLAGRPSTQRGSECAGNCRAEATDVANAVLDGVDGILLGAETLRGKYPVQTVQTILAICHQAEKAFDHNYHFEHLMQVSSATQRCNY